MSSVPQSIIPTPQRSENVVMGRQDFLSVFLRATGGELYKIRRRLMSKILLFIAIPLMLIIFAFVLLIVAINVNTPATTYLIPCSSRASFARNTSTLPCKQGETPTQNEIQQAEAYKQAQIKQVSEPLRLPGSLSFAVGTINYVGLIILIILTASLVGGEYGIGTIRLLLTRGPTRLQYFLAKIFAILITVVALVLLLTIIGIIVGALFNLVSGIGVDFGFLNGTWILHAILYLLICMLGLFVWTMITLFLSTIGKSTAAGLAGGLVWWFLEGVIGTILGIVGGLTKGQFGDFLKAVPDYFIGNNVGALLDNQNQYLTQGTPSPISDLHAILVLLAYLVVFLGIALWVHLRRDVTN